ncbi:putative skeletal organic matrix protein 8 [Crassostrea virginica]
MMLPVISLTFMVNFANALPIFEKGSRTDDGLVRLCTSSSVITDLGVDHWPRYVTEITCHGTDTTCLNLHNNPHEVTPPEIMPAQGRCTESVIHMNLLRFENATSSGTGVWKPYSQAIRGGCVCGFDKRSRVLHSFFYLSQLRGS